MPLISSAFDIRTGAIPVVSAYLGSSLCWQRAADIPHIPLEYLTLRWARLSNPTTWLTSRPADATPENCICQLYQCSNELTGSYSIPLTDEIGIPVRQIAPRCFYQVVGLAAIVIGSHITEIGSEAFMYSGLVTLTIEASAVFNNFNFRQCPNLESVFFGENIEIPLNTATWIFAQCPKLSVFNPSELGDAVLKAGFYGSRAFAYNTTLTEVVFPEDFAPPNASSCGYYFDECTNLKAVKVYNPAMLFPANMFTNVPALTTVYGYPGSTAEAWAAANSKIFIVL